MQTGNTRYLDTEENRKFYAESDGVYMPPERVLNCSDVLPRIAWVREWIHSNCLRTVFDVGCKDGYMCLQLAAEGKDCVAIDPSIDCIQRAIQLNEHFDLDVKYIHSFLEDYDLGKDEIIAKHGKYEAVVSLEVLEHVVDEDAFLTKLAQAGFMVFISTPDYYGKHGIEDAKRNEAHVRLYTKEELEKLVSKYGHIRESVVIDDQICIAFQSNL